MPANTKDCPYSEDQANQPLLRSTYPETGTVASATSVASYMELTHPTTIVDESPIQVNIFLKLSFLNQLTHNMTRDCSLISPKNTSSEHLV